MSHSSLQLHTHFQYEKIKQAFIAELVNASLGKPSSIAWIEHILPSKSLLTHGIVQGIVIGGTNYIISTESIEPNGERTILNRYTGILPIFDTKERFAAFLIEHLDARADAIGINFGFRMRPIHGKTGYLDGIIQAIGTKDHTFTGLDEPIGEFTSKLFIKHYHKEIPITIANDTVCLLLAGSGQENGSLIAGTGFNIGLCKKQANQRVLINLEAGGFNQFPLSDVLKIIDSGTKNPGAKLFEKIISGKYLAKYFNEKAKQLALPIAPIQTSQELSELSHTNHADTAGDLARTILKRSAFLVAAAIAGLYEFAGSPDSLEIIGEGSLLWKGWKYHEHIQQKLTELGIPPHAIAIKHIPDSSINGAIGLVTK